MTTWIEITEEAFVVLRGNDEQAWRDYKSSELAECTYYCNRGVRLQAVHNFVGSITQYYIQDISA